MNCVGASASCFIAQFFKLQMTQLIHLREHLFSKHDRYISREVLHSI